MVVSSGLAVLMFSYLAILGDVMSDLEVSVSSGTFGVNHTLRDPLSIEVSHLIDEDDILEQN